MPRFGNAMINKKRENVDLYQENYCTETNKKQKIWTKTSTAPVVTRINFQPVLLTDF